MANLLSVEIVSQYVAALAAGDTERMNALRTPDFELDFVYGDHQPVDPCHPKKPSSSGRHGWWVFRRRITR